MVSVVTSSRSSVSLKLRSLLTPESFVPLYVSWYWNGPASGKGSFHDRVNAGWSVMAIGTIRKPSTAGAKSVCMGGEGGREGGRLLMEEHSQGCTQN